MLKWPQESTQMMTKKKSTKFHVFIRYWRIYYALNSVKKIFDSDF